LTTGASKPFLIQDKSSLSSEKISYEVISESNNDNPVNLDLAIIRLETPDGLVFSLPSISSVNDISKYLDDDISLTSDKYKIAATQGSHVSSYMFEYIQ